MRTVVTQRKLDHFTDTAADTLAGGRRAGDSPVHTGLVQGDVLDVLARVPDDTKFDVVIADPPYNIGKDFGNDSDSRPMAQYVEWSEAWIARCLDLLAQGGILYIYGFPETLAHLAVRYPLESQHWLAWHYTNKAVPKARFWQRSHESILCLWPLGRPRPVLEVDQIREPYTDTYRKNAVGKVRTGTDSRFGGRNGRETLYKDHGGALPRDILKVPALAGGAGAAERWFKCYDCGGMVFPPQQAKHHRGHTTMKHPTQKPMELTRRLIRSRITGNRGRLMVPFAGSGSECVVAMDMGIDWLGIEINPEYVDFARQWMGYVSSDRQNGAAPRAGSKAIPRPVHRGPLPGLGDGRTACAGDQGGHKRGPSPRVERSRTRRPG
ncbi:MAG: site-specific DNA-methyltransferase [Rhodobacteraceae bacterium]|nr:site-specific DNA-methyltransferase [Paracoccaceae bacterium]